LGVDFLVSAALYGGDVVVADDEAAFLGVVLDTAAGAGVGAGVGGAAGAVAGVGGASSAASGCKKHGVSWLHRRVTIGTFKQIS
jgi:hypothetical protein